MKQPFLSEMRQQMIENFQSSMRAVRLLMGYSVNELAEYVNVTRQTINNLETGKSKMSAMQFLALAAVVDNYTQSNGELYPAIETILDGNGKRMSKSYDTSFSSQSLLKRWFLLFDVVGTKSDLGLYEGNLILSEQQLGQLIWKCKIFVDADVLMEKHAEIFFQMFTEKLAQCKEKIIFPLKVIEKIQGLTCDPKETQNAMRALRLINEMQQKGVVQIRGEEFDPELHDTIRSVFQKFRKMYRLCIITQNGAFANEILQMNHSCDNDGFDIFAGYLNNDGEFELYSDKEEQPQCEQSDSLEGAMKSEINTPTGWEML